MASDVRSNKTTVKHQVTKELTRPFLNENSLMLCSFFRAHLENQVLETVYLPSRPMKAIQAGINRYRRRVQDQVLNLSVESVDWLETQTLCSVWIAVEEREISETGAGLDHG